jgi:Endopolygalacturonase
MHFSFLGLSHAGFGVSYGNYGLRTVIVSVLMLFASLASAQCPAEIEPIKAPFDMPQLQRPVFPARKVVIKKGQNIQAAIDKLAKKGGGTVVVPKGKWHTGRIILKSNICLQVDEGAELCFSGDVKDYLPVVPCRNEGVDIYGPGAMIYADGAENIAVVGKGKLVAPSRDCELLKLTMAGIPEAVQAMPLKERVFDGTIPTERYGFEARSPKTMQTSAGERHLGTLCLPVFFGPMNSRNVLLEGVTLEGSIFWNIVPVYCENIIIRGVTVSSAGIARTDGIDIDSSRNALIEYTTLDCGDDCFTLKAGRGMDGLLKARPTENVVIRHCTAKRGAGGLTVGSETAAGIRNVYMYDVTIENPKYGIYFKTRLPRGGGGENLWFENVRMVHPKTRAIYWDMLGSATYVGKLAERFNKDNNPKLTPYFRNIHFDGLTVEHCTDFVKAIGLPESPVENVTFKNVSSPACKKVTLQDVGTFVIEVK